MAGHACPRALIRGTRPSSLDRRVKPTDGGQVTFSLDRVPYVFYGACMDRNFAIERSRGRLVAVVVELFAMIGLIEGGMVERVSRPVYRKVQRILRSAESAVRRLIIASARDIVVAPSPKRPAPAERIKLQRKQNQKPREEGNRKAMLTVNAACSSGCSIGPGERIGAFPAGAKSATRSSPASAC